MKLQIYLEEASITQEQFASSLGVTQASVSRWVQGKKLPRPDAMRRISEATSGKVSPDDFYDLEGGQC
jgi:transcriptional regulator with XRE-family HTH domain